MTTLMIPLGSATPQDIQELKDYLDNEMWAYSIEED